MICHDVFDCTVDLVGKLNGNGQKGMLQIDAPFVEISGYATVCLSACIIAVHAASDVPNRNFFKLLISNDCRLVRVRVRGPKPTPGP